MQTLKILTAGAVLTGALASAPAFAGGDSGFYIGAGVGQSSVGDIDDDEFGSIDFDGDDTGYKAIVGYHFGMVPLVDLAVEAEYIDFGKPDDGGLELEPSALAAFGLAGVNLGPIGIFGKAGVFTWDVDISDGVDSGSEDGTDMAYGGGLRFQIASFQIRAEYEFFDTDAANLDLISASLLYTF